MAEMNELRDEIRKLCHEVYLVCGENDEPSMWLEKGIQLYRMSQNHHGIVMVGPSGSGKSLAQSALLLALDRLEEIDGVAHVIDPKAISKEALYGVLDPNTREWTDGIFTHILRKIIDNVRGEINKRQWIIFDGDIDPEWAENLNSVLDDNKLLTLPNGERLSIPPNVRIIFEVQDLKYASLATVSRCGIVWFSEDVFTNKMLVELFFSQLRHAPLKLKKGEEDSVTSSGKPGDKEAEEVISPTIQVQRDVANILQPYFSPDGIVNSALEYAAIHLEHIMDFTRFRALSSLFSMLKQAVRNVLNYNHTHMDFPMQSDQLNRYMKKALVDAILWSFAGDGKLKARNDLGKFLRSLTTIPLPSPNMPIMDYEVSFEGEWIPWLDEVPEEDVTTLDIIVPTLDTVRHGRIINSYSADKRPVLLCGPTGSGKTTTIISTLRAIPNVEVVRVIFSPATSPETLLKTLERHCGYHKTPNGLILVPSLGKWLVLFCDKINLPDMDKYGTQRVISFLRQLGEEGGFWRPTPGGSSGEPSWVSIKRIQFVGACNPPTDPGCKPLTHRFLNNVAVIYVDYPSQTSLKQIYATLNRGMLDHFRSLKPYADQLTDAMVEFYQLSQERFTQDMQPHYVYSLRELTRWVRGISEAIGQREKLSVEDLVRLWAHEGLRLFQDRLVDDTERKWTNENIDSVGLKYFPKINREDALARPILFSNWLSKDGNYIHVDREELRSYVKGRLKYYKEELDVPLVLFDEFLDHVLRIDRIFRQPQGHLLLIGVSGAGKTTLSHFVAWMNGLSVFQVKVHNKYTAADFDEDLRQLLRQVGREGKKVCFLLDESNILESSFLERMNTLLANGEVPGLFEGDEYTTLMTQCKEGAQSEGLMLDSAEELYKWFTQRVIRNLHVVFTMISSSEGLKDRASTSASFFNHFVINWLGDWSDSAFFQVGNELTNRVDLEKNKLVSK